MAFTSIQVSPGIAVIEDLVPDDLADAIVEAAEAARCFRKTDGSTYYPDVFLYNISASLSERFDAWVEEVAVPLVERALGARVRLYPPSVAPGDAEPKGSKGQPVSSPFTFVVKYSADTQLETAPHLDWHAGATLVLNLNDDCVGGGTCFPDHGVVVRPCKGAGVIFRGCEEQHMGFPVDEGQRYITTTWFALDED